MAILRVSARNSAILGDFLQKLGNFQNFYAVLATSGEKNQNFDSISLPLHLKLIQRKKDCALVWELSSGLMFGVGYNAAGYRYCYGFVN